MTLKDSSLTVAVTHDWCQFNDDDDDDDDDDADDDDDVHNHIHDLYMLSSFNIKSQQHCI